MTPSKVAVASLGLWPWLCPSSRPLSLEAHGSSAQPPKSARALGLATPMNLSAWDPQRTPREAPAFQPSSLPCRSVGFKARTPAAQGLCPAAPHGSPRCPPTARRAPALRHHSQALYLLLQEQHLGLPAGRLLAERLQPVSAACWGPGLWLDLPLGSLPR